MVIDEYLDTDKFVIFSKEWCGYCKKAKKLLTTKELEFIEINLEEISDYEEVKAELYELSGQKTVPQIFLNKQLIGGYKELEKYF